MDISHSNSEVKRSEPGRPAQPTAQDRVASLLYLNSNNADEKIFEINGYLCSQGKSEKELFASNLTSYQKKQAYTLKENTEKFIKEVGIDRVGFLTLTFADNVTDHKEAYRRFNNLRKQYISKVYGRWMRVSERQKRGAWHFHMLVECKTDIRTGFDFQSYNQIGRLRVDGFTKNKKSILQLERKLARSASKPLKNMWYAQIEAMKKYHFGRPHLAPIEKNATAAALYVSKYLSKHNVCRDKRDKGVRLVGYSTDMTRSNTDYQWNSDGSKEWRKKLCKTALILGFSDISEFSHHFGAGWCHRLQPFILNVDHLPLDGFVKICNQMSRFGSPFSTDFVPAPLPKSSSSPLLQKKPPERKKYKNKREEFLRYLKKKEFEKNQPPLEINRKTNDLVDTKTGEVFF